MNSLKYCNYPMTNKEIRIRSNFAIILWRMDNKEIIYLSIVNSHKLLKYLFIYLALPWNGILVGIMNLLEYYNYPMTNREMIKVALRIFSKPLLKWWFCSNISIILWRMFKWWIRSNSAIILWRIKFIIVLRVKCHLFLSLFFVFISQWIYCVSLSLDRK